MVAALIVTVLMLSGLSGTAHGEASAASGGVLFHELTYGSRGAMLPGESKSANGRVLRSAAEATRVLRAWGLDSSATKSVDFRRDSLIVMLTTWQPSGGYRARVWRVVVQGHEAVVTAGVRREGGDMASSSLERPWVVVAVKRAALAGLGNEVRIRLR
jgi:hypothetical protein